MPAVHSVCVSLEDSYACYKPTVSVDEPLYNQTRALYISCVESFPSRDQSLSSQPSDLRFHLTMCQTGPTCYHDPNYILCKTIQYKITS